MELKHQDIIKKLCPDIQCPPQTVSGRDSEAYRWVRSPIENDLNFLPNYLFDTATAGVDNYLGSKFTSLDKCLRCGQSMFENQKAAEIAYTKLSTKRKRTLGYTHLAKGNITINDGLATFVNGSGHFGFYEFKDCLLESRFFILCELSNS